MSPSCAPMRAGVFLACALLISWAGQLSAQSSGGTPGIADRQAVIDFMTLASQPGANIPQPSQIPETLPNPRFAVPAAGVQGSGAYAPMGGTFSPPLADSFQALDDSGTIIPPDTHGAVGPNHVMTTLNSQVRIQSRTGTTISTVTLNAFWASVGTPSCFDPKILYDEFANRWVFTACANSRSANSALLIGASQTSDPTGAWNLFSIDADASNITWFDYPSIGFNNKWVCVSGNMFTVTGSSFVRNNFWVISRAALYAGTAPFTLLQDSSGGFTMSPALTHDMTQPTLYLLEDWDGPSGQLRMSTITGNVGAEVLTIGSTITVAATWEDNPPTGNFCPQLGATQKINANDARIANVVFRNGRLWTSHTVFLPVGAPTRCSIQWWEISTTGTVQQRGRVDDPTGANFYAFSSLNVNRRNDVLLGYSRFSATSFASAYYSYRTAVDAAGTMQVEALLKAGEAKYFKDFGSGRNRWGDYSNTCVDPLDDLGFWTIQEYAATPTSADRWGTWWGHVVVPMALIVPTGGSTNVAEGGATDTYSVVLSVLPTANVVVAVTPDSQSTVSSATLTFTTANWNVAQNITVTAVNDALVEGPHTSAISHTSTSADPNYSGAVFDAVIANITDNDVAGVTVVQSGGTTGVTEGGATDSYTLVLTAQPLQPVQVNLTGNAQISLSSGTVTFTNANWNVTQTVTVTAVNDFLVEGPQVAAITHSTTSTDANFNALTVAGVSVAITDNDVAGVTLTQSGGSTNIAEGGATDSYTLVLTAQPLQPVTLSLTPDSQSTLSAASLLFTAGNWNVAQSVTVTAFDDSFAEGLHASLITHATTCADANFNALAVSSVTANITDNDFADILLAETNGDTTCGEQGYADVFSLVLTSQPLANVSITISPDSQLATSVSSVTFTPGNWDQVVYVSVLGRNDSVVEGDHTGVVSFSVTSTDVAYNALPVGPLNVQVLDPRVVGGGGGESNKSSGGGCSTDESHELGWLLLALLAFASVVTRLRRRA